jgi:hypothetical protein
MAVLSFDSLSYIVSGVVALRLIGGLVAARATVPDAPLKQEPAEG